MFLPIVSFADGYGFTYGGRMSTVGLLGAGERLSIPLTWGGTRRAALEFERSFERGPLTRVESSVGVSNRRNPRFAIRDGRIEVRGRAERVFADVVRTGIDASRSTIDFGALDDRLWTVGANIALDTRLDPAFPGNAVYLGAGWTGMHFRSLPGGLNRYTTDARGYVRVFRQVVVAGRVQYTGADAGLPPYERLLLGGSSSLRGFGTGTFDGDRMLVTSAELRVPVTSVLHASKLGVTAFVDAGEAWDHGRPRSAARWHRGIGGGVFLIASLVRINLDVARGLKDGGTRLHLSTGFAF
jgi:outer membrane protein assembly factor BamA